MVSPSLASQQQDSGRKSTTKIAILQASSPSHLTAIQHLFTAYASSLGIDLSFQKFEEELSSLPGYYATPTGCLLLAFLNSGEVSDAPGRGGTMKDSLEKEESLTTEVSIPSETGHRINGKRDDLELEEDSYPSRRYDGKRIMPDNSESSTTKTSTPFATSHGSLSSQDPLTNTTYSTATTVLESVAEPVPVGCVALRPLSPSSKPGSAGTPKGTWVCEMKRLYCVPASRGLGIGRILVEAVVKEAERLGYQEIRLDTLPQMEGARRLYTEWGFVDCDRYYETPLEGTIFLSKKLGMRREDVENELK